MATRMQQRRGTATQWTSANPVLAAGEIGFETDTSKFKVGDGTNTWANLSYFTNADNIGDALEDYILATEKGEPLGVATLDANGQVPLSQLSLVLDGAPEALNTLNELAAALDDDANFASTIANELNSKVSSTTLTESLDGLKDDILEGSTFNNATLSGTTVLPSSTSIGSVSQEEIGYLNGVTSAIQTQFENIGIDISDIQTDLSNKADSATVSSTYAPLNAPTFTGNVVLPNTTSIGNITATELGYVTNVTSDIQTQLDSKAPTANPTFTGTVSGVTKSHVGLGNVDNTSDANKPVSTATQTALNAKANLSGATFTGAVTVEGNLTVSGTTTTVSAQDLVVSDPLIYIGEGNTANLVDIGLVGNFNNGTYQHTGLVRDASANTWKLFTGVTDEPTTTVNFSQGTLDDIQVKNITAAGVVFTDGTQTLEGVPSRTVILQRTASYTLTGIERDDLIEMSSASALTLTIPTDATFNFPVGTSIDILQTNTGQITIAGASGVTVNATPGLKLRTQWSSATLFKRAANTWVVYGDLTA